MYRSLDDSLAETMVMTLSDQRLIDKDGNLVETRASQLENFKRFQSPLSICSRPIRQDELSNVNLCLACLVRVIQGPCLPPSFANGRLDSDKAKKNEAIRQTMEVVA